MQDTTRNVFDKISNMYYGLTASEKKTADFVMSHRTETQYMSIADLADASGVAEATVSRFCRTLGYEGYNLFKLAIANASSASDVGSEMPEGNVTENDSFTEMCQKLFAADRDAMVQTMSVIDKSHIAEAVDMLAGAKKVLCMGQGGSMLLASECAHLFSTVAGKFFSVADSHSQIIAAANMSSDDVLLFFSYSGATRDMLETLTVAKENKVRVILITRFPKSPGAAYADLVLPCGSNESPLQLSSVAAKIAQLYLMDVLFTEYCRREPETALKSREKIASALAKKHL